MDVTDRTTRATVDVLYGERVDAGRWASRHSAGQVPDRMPYGLDRLAEHGLAVSPPRPSSSSTTPGHLGRLVARRAGGGYDWGVVTAWRPRGDVVLSWAEQTGVPVSLVHGKRVPVVTGVIWATDTAVPARVRTAVRAGLQRASGVVVLSSAQVRPLVEMGLDPERVHVLPFGIDVEFFTPSGAGVDRNLVVSVGNDRHRDWPAVFEAFAALRRRLPEARLTVVSRSLPERLVRRADQLTGVTIVPHLDHEALRALVERASALLVLTTPNLHASGVTAALEAQALGRPAVVTDLPGMRDYATSDSGMVLVPLSDAGAVAEQLLGLMSDAAVADALGAAGRRAVISRFSTTEQARVLAGVLKRATR